MYKDDLIVGYVIGQFNWLANLSRRLRRAGKSSEAVSWRISKKIRDGDDNKGQ